MRWVHVISAASALAAGGAEVLEYHIEMEGLRLG